MSKYHDYQADAVTWMSQSGDRGVRDLEGQIRAGKRVTDEALKAVNRRLVQINSGSAEGRALRHAAESLDAMRTIESTWTREERVPGQPARRSTNAVHDQLAKEMVSAGAQRQAATDIAFLLAWEATGRNLGDLIRIHPHAFESFGMAVRPLPKRTLMQWLDRAHHLASGGR